LIRSARSIPANIAEGYGRFSYKDQIHFCVQARGSLYESYNHIIDAFDCNYITEAVKQEYKLRVNDVEKLLNGYIAWLRKMITESGNK
jgi:four helix bundle protein